MKDRITQFLQRFNYRNLDHARQQREKLQAENEHARTTPHARSTLSVNDKQKGITNYW